jgi:hypothetical protein
LCKDLLMSRIDLTPIQYSRRTQLVMLSKALTSATSCARRRRRSSESTWSAQLARSVPRSPVPPLGGELPFQSDCRYERRERRGLDVKLRRMARILVIEDNPQTLETYAAVLRAAA